MIILALPLVIVSYVASLLPCKAPTFQNGQVYCKNNTPELVLYKNYLIRCNKPTIGFDSDIHKKDGPWDIILDQCRYASPPVQSKTAVKQNEDRSSTIPITKDATTVKIRYLCSQKNANTFII